MNGNAVFGVVALSAVILFGIVWRNQVATLQRNLLTALDDLATLDAENRALLQERTELEQENAGLSAALNESEATIQRQAAMLAVKKSQSQTVKSFLLPGNPRWN